MFLVNSTLAKFFYLGATYFFSAYDFMVDIRFRPKYFWVPLAISTPVGRLVILDLKCQGVEVSLDGLQLISSLVMLSMVNWDVILSIDWLS